MYLSVCIVYLLVYSGIKFWYFFLSRVRIRRSMDESGLTAIFNADTLTSYLNNFLNYQVPHFDNTVDNDARFLYCSDVVSHAVCVPQLRTFQSSMQVCILTSFFINQLRHFRLLLTFTMTKTGLSQRVTNSCYVQLNTYGVGALLTTPV